MPEDTRHTDVAYPTSPHAKPRLSTGDILRVLWRGKWILVGWVALGLVLAVIDLRFSKPIYTMTIAAVPKESQASPNNPLLAAFAQLRNTQGVESNAFDKFTILLGSRRLAEALEKKYGLMRQIFAAQWDPVSQTFPRPSGTVFDFKQWLKALLGLPPWTAPDIDDLAGAVGGAVLISKPTDQLFGEARIIRITLKDPDPEFGAKLLREIFATADDLIRADKEAEYQANIAYLQQQSALATQQDLRGALTQMLAQEIRNDMLLREGAATIADVVEWPYPPTHPSSPNGKLILVLGVVIGLTIGVAGALLYGLPSRSSLTDEEARRSDVGALRRPTSSMVPD